TGDTIWTATVGNAISSSPAVTGGVVYVGSWDHNLYAFDAMTGQKLWSAATGAKIQSSPAVANGLVYVGSDDKRLWAFDRATGATVWKSSVKGAYVVGSPTVCDRLVVV